MTALYIFISFVASALTSMLLMPWILSLCKRNGYFDMPNDRKVHKNNTPRLGGVVFVPSAIVGIAATLAIVFNFYGENCLIQDEPATLADACLRIMNHPDLRQQLAINGYEMVKQHYSWKEKIYGYVR